VCGVFSSEYREDDKVHRLFIQLQNCTSSVRRRKPRLNRPEWCRPAWSKFVHKLGSKVCVYAHKLSSGRNIRVDPKSRRRGVRLTIRGSRKPLNTIPTFSHNFVLGESLQRRHILKSRPKVSFPPSPSPQRISQHSPPPLPSPLIRRFVMFGSIPTASDRSYIH
jgi:hypothetical protein